MKHIASLSNPVDGYLEHQRALGRSYYQEEWILTSLSRFLCEREYEALDQRVFEEWCQSFSPISPNTLRARQRCVRKFCLYHRRTQPECFVPDAYRFAKRKPYINPVIFGPDEIARMLSASGNISSASLSPLRPALVRLAIVLLYTAGLRRGELLRLMLADVNASSGILRIRESKFHKSREVPLSTDAQRELRIYLKQRLAPPFKTTPDSPLLCHLRNSSGALLGYTGTGLSNSLREVFKAANVHGSEGQRPRVHDFRHSFAVQALLRWYQQGADVQSNLPKLAMYMGHVSIVSTACYLQWIPAIAEAASDRFEANFGYLTGGGCS